MTCENPRKPNITAASPPAGPRKVQESTDYLSQRFREQLGRPEVALRIARVLAEQEHHNRHYLCELAVCYGALTQHACNACISLAGVADYDDVEAPRNNEAKVALAQLGYALGALYERYHADAYAKGSAAAATLGLELDLDMTTEGHFERYLRAATMRGVPRIAPDDAPELLIAAAELAWHHQETDVPRTIVRPNGVSVRGLCRLCDVAD